MATGLDSVAPGLDYMTLKLDLVTLQLGAVGLPSKNWNCSVFLITEKNIIIFRGEDPSITPTSD